MEVSTIILFSLLSCGVKAIEADASLSTLATRVRLVEGEIHAWKLTAVNTEQNLMNKFQLLELSLKEELIERFLPPLIKPLVEHAISDIMKGDHIGNIISGHVLDEVQSLKTSVQVIKTQLKSVIQQLKRVERDRDTYRMGLRKQRRRLTEDIRALQLQVNNTVADCGVARTLKSELNQANNDLYDTKRDIIGLTQDFIALNTSCVMLGNEVESCMDGMQEIRLKLPTDIQSLTIQLNQTKEDLLHTKEVINGLTEDLMTLNTSCEMKKEINPSDRNESSLTATTLSQVSVTTSTTMFPGTVAASTGPSPSNTVSSAPVMTQNSDQHASTTDASKNLTPSKAVPSAPVTTQDSDAHATPSPARNRDLLSASEDGDLERVKRILEAGHVNINTRGWYSMTPVMWAARWGHRDVVELLVGRGADVSLVDRWGNNILHVACIGGDLGTVELLLSLNKVDVNSRGQDSRTPVMEAAGNGHMDVVELLVGRGADVSPVDRRGYNVLHLACYSGDLGTVEMILSLDKVDVNSRGGNSRTPVMWAARYGHGDVVELLVGRGADVSLVDRDGNNILHVACMGGDLGTVEMILSLDKVDVNARNNYGKTAADWARISGHQRVLDLLVSRGAH